MVYIKRDVSARWTMLLVLLAVISLPNFLISGGAQAAKTFHLKPYWPIIKERNEVVTAVGGLAAWARAETGGKSVFMFIIDREAHSDPFSYINASTYFKTRAARPTTPGWDELTHFPTLRQRRAHADEYNMFMKAVRADDIGSIAQRAGNMNVSYVVCSELTLNICKSLSDKMVFDSPHVKAFSLSR